MLRAIVLGDFARKRNTYVDGETMSLADDNYIFNLSAA